MRKIPPKYENPIDNILISIVDKIQPTFYKFGFTPNMITTLSLISFVIGIYFLVDCSNYIFLTTFFLFLSYFFDCFDGHFARSYNMVTRFGDYYDHILDITKNILLFVLLYRMIPDFTIKMTLFFFVLFFLICMMIHLSCQELYYGVTSDTLYFLRYFCPANKNNVNQFLTITRYFGSGTFNLILLIIIIYAKNENVICNSDIKLFEKMYPVISI